MFEKGGETKATLIRLPQLVIICWPGHDFQDVEYQAAPIPTQSTGILTGVDFIDFIYFKINIAFLHCKYFLICI